jgi:hypothetical protein
MILPYQQHRASSSMAAPAPAPPMADRALARRTMLPALRPVELSIDTDVPPALPARSALRASHMLASPVDLKAFADATATPAGAAALLAAAGGSTPHEIYLSSEEDASSSADDFSDAESPEGEEDVVDTEGDAAKEDADADADMDMDDADEVDPDDDVIEIAAAEVVPVQQLPEERRRRSSQQQDATAKAVSVVYAGRPSIVTLSPSRATFAAAAAVPPTPTTATAPHFGGIARPPSAASSTASDAPVVIRPLGRAATDSSLGAASFASSSSSSSRRLSVASTTSARFPHPPRSSSMYMMPAPSRKPSFLNIDPFAAPPPGTSHSMDAPSIKEEDYHDDDDDTASMKATATAPAATTSSDSPPAAPRTPKTPSAMFRRGLSLVRKRSRPLLANFGAASSADHPMPPLPSSMPILHIQTAGMADARRCETPSGLQTPVSAMPFSFGAAQFAAMSRGNGSSDYLPTPLASKPVRMVSTPASTPLSPLSTSPSPPAARSSNKGRLLGFRRQSLSFRGV